MILYIPITVHQMMQVVLRRETSLRLNSMLKWFIPVKDGFKILLYCIEKTNLLEPLSRL